MSSDQEYVKKSKKISYCSICGAKIFSKEIFCFECGVPDLPEKEPEEAGISFLQAIIRIGFLGFLFLCVFLIKFDSHVDGFFSSLDINLEEPLLKASENNQSGRFDLIHTVIPASANIRSKPSMDGHVITVVEKGMNLILIEQKNDWAKVRVFEKIGWIASRLIKSEVQELN
jgi:hypothetical protein